MLSKLNTVVVAALAEAPAAHRHTTKETRRTRRSDGRTLGVMPLRSCEEPANWDISLFDLLGTELAARMGHRHPICVSDTPRRSCEAFLAMARIAQPFSRLEAESGIIAQRFAVDRIKRSSSDSQRRDRLTAGLRCPMISRWPIPKPLIWLDSP